MFSEMSLGALSYDMVTGEPLIVLKNTSKTTSFLVKGGNQDVKSLMAEFSGTVADASSPHSLVVKIIQSLNGDIKRLEITMDPHTVQQGIIYYNVGDKQFVQSCRPVDVVVLGNKLSLPVFVSTDLISQESGVVEDCSMNKFMKREEPMDIPPVDKDLLM